MSAAKTIFAVTFVLSLCVTLIAPSFPPAPFLYRYVGIQQTTLSILEIPVANLLNGLTNGFFWTIIIAGIYGVVQLALHARRPRLLPPMPMAPQLVTPLPMNPLVDTQVNIIPPALTVPPGVSSFTLREESPVADMRTKAVSVKFSRVPFGSEMNVDSFKGIGLVCGGILRNLGIFTVSDLLRVGATERGRNRIANEVGVTSETVRKWIHREDLLRVKGIGGKYSALLESAGVNTVVGLSTKNPRRLSQTLKTVNRDKNLVERIPPSKTIKIWVHNAQNLEPILAE